MKPLPASGSPVRKLWQYARLYGWRRTLAKAAGRRGLGWLAPLIRRPAGGAANGVSFIGCGQAAFSTLCYFLAESRAARFIAAYDPRPEAAARLARFYRFGAAVADAETAMSYPGTEIVYIASNHASHADYAIAALALGRTVYVEKPICTNWEQFFRLKAASDDRPGKLFAGYNRPFSAAVKTLVREIRDSRVPFSLSCYVHGHLLPADHWYRRPEEGSRVCGNAGHWFDLFIHLLAAVWGEIPQHYYATYLPADSTEADDNFSLSLRSPRGDVFQLMLSSRSEPFEGIREHIELQQASLSATIEDFRSLVLRRGAGQIRTAYSPKDVGHRAATLQPFLPGAEARGLHEVWASTALMLRIADMARSGTAAMHLDLQPA